jgi:hypothetical protein
MNDQTDRIIIKKALADMELKLKELEILYEKYFAKVEKREPIKEREDLARRLRQFLNRKIMQTDMNFRYQNISSRFHSYVQYWDRIVRLIEEGKYFRGQPGGVPAPPVTKPSAPSGEDEQIDTLYQEFLKVRESCQVDAKAPNRSQVAAFLAQQKEKIAQKTGSSDVNLTFRVVEENGKPKIKVKVKKK